MKELTKYIVLDGDSVGTSVGSIVLSDDASALSTLSENINAGTQIFSQWAEFNGGKVISNGSDEAVLEVPVESLKDLETLRSEYQAKTGFTVSIGTGDTLSSAMKALIYAKMNGKNQITEYSPEMDQAMQQSGPDNEVQTEGEDQLPHQEEFGTDVPEHEQELSPEDKQMHDSTETMSDEEEIQTEELAAVGEESLDQAPEMQAQTDEEVPEMQAPSEEQAMEEMVDSNNPQAEDIDLDGRPDMNEAHGEIMPEDDVDGDGDVEHEEAMAVEGGAEEGYSDEGDQGDDSLSSSIEEEMSDGEEIPMEEADGAETPMEEVIPGEEAPMMEEGMEEEAPMEEGMEEEEAPMMEEDGAEMPMEEAIPGEEAPMEEGADHDSLKSIIFESLQNFKENREYLERISQENPELYQSLIYVLQAMIEMARELGYGNMDEDGSMLGEDEEVMGNMSPEETMDEAVEIEEEMEGEEMSEEYDESSEEKEESSSESEEKEEESENDAPDFFKKNEKLIGLIKTINSKFKGLVKGEEKEAIKEMKDKMKGKKKAPSSKKKAGKTSNKKKGGVENKQPNNKGGQTSFCAKSHDKMKASGKDCRSNEDADSPLCAARQKFDCRGKNAGGSMNKSEKLSNYMDNKRKK